MTLDGNPEVISLLEIFYNKNIRRDILQGIIINAIEFITALASYSDKLENYEIYHKTIDSTDLLEKIIAMEISICQLRIILADDNKISYQEVREKNRDIFKQKNGKDIQLSDDDLESLFYNMTLNYSECPSKIFDIIKNVSSYITNIEKYKDKQVSYEDMAKKLPFFVTPIFQIRAYLQRYDNKSEQIQKLRLKKIEQIKHQLETKGKNVI
jgi:CO dehydrogenase/acetyl-CoA synthase beta subunit